MVAVPFEFPPMHPVAGFRLGSAWTGLPPKRDGLAVMELAQGASVAALFTRNAFRAAPIHIARAHLADCAPRCLVVNTGSANAVTGEAGLRDARAVCAALAPLVGVETEAVLPFSTGVIGAPLAVDAICAALPDAVAALSAQGWEAAADAIRTTDTLPKGASRQTTVDGKRVVVSGIAKGAGMIRPDMATMLAFVATDAAVERGLLQRLLAEAAEASFNRISVDGDTSTNDACVLIATGRGAATFDAQTPPAALRPLRDALRAVCVELAQKIVRDGEGATKFIAVRVEGGRDAAESLRVAYAVAHSPLVKSAFFASDPNWGRILAAVGRAEGLDDLDPAGVTLWLNDLCVVRNGACAAGYAEARGRAVMACAEIVVRIALGRGDAAETVWTSDLSYEYVKINAEYRT